MSNFNAEHLEEMLKKQDKVSEKFFEYLKAKKMGNNNANFNSDSKQLFSKKSNQTQEREM